MQLIDTACFYPWEDNKGGFTVEVHDLPGCVTEGATLAEAMYMVRDAASDRILDEIENGKKIRKQAA